MTTPITAFISYEWGDPSHTEWVRKFAIQLRKDGIDAILDKWAVLPGDDFTAFMESSVRDSDFVLVVCTPRYKEKSDTRKGGVGYEGSVMTGELVSSQHTRKFIPVLRTGDWKNSSPSWIRNRSCVDLRGDPYEPSQYNDLILSLRGQSEKPPPLGTTMETTAPAITSTGTSAPSLVPKIPSDRPIEKFTENELLSTTDANIFSTELIRRYIDAKTGSPTLRVSFTPSPLDPTQPLRVREDEMMELMRYPPRLRHSGWFVYNPKQPKRFPMGLQMIGDHGTKLELLWNGTIIYSAGMNTESAKWAYKEYKPKGKVVNPLAWIEPIVQCTALFGAVVSSLPGIVQVRPDVGFFSASDVYITPCSTESRAMIHELDGAIKPVDRNVVQVHPKLIDIADLSESHSRDLAAEMLAEIGFQKNSFSVPSFDESGHFTAE